MIAHEPHTAHCCQELRINSPSKLHLHLLHLYEALKAYHRVSRATLTEHDG